ncbi:MAG: calcium-binding protein [Alphaproteobacteria bacterium]|nr:calcium-binding protein [Alphaproteobacteria bacterium]
MSTTGNLLFPESDDDGWVSSIIKALPDPPKSKTPESETIEDPVAIEAEARFSELAAKTAEQEAISAAGWSAEALIPTSPRPTPEDGLSKAALDALDAVVDRETLKDTGLSGTDDPVALEAASAFAQAAAETAAEAAVQTAGWAVEVQRAEEATPALAQQQPQAPDVETQFSPEALAALDSVLAHDDVSSELTTIDDDPVALEADATFAEAAAIEATKNAAQTAGWTAEVHSQAKPLSALAENQQPDDIETAPEFSPEALEALDSVLARGDVQNDLAADITDPVALEADAAFYEAAADVVSEHAIFAAGWSAMARKPGDGVGVATLTPGERLALDAAMASEARNPGHLSATDDPVRLAGDAVFSEVAADVEVRDAIRLAEWTPQSTPGKSPLEIAKVEEVVRPEVLDALSPLSPSEQRALDAAQADQFASRSGPAAGADPVALEADALFTDMAADLVIEDAIRTARRDARPDPGMVVQAEPRQQPIGPGFWEVEDLVRAEAEIAFDDAAFDLAYNAVDSLVTGEAAALAAFDRAIASGADPQEALALAIAAAEQVDPKTFGPTQVAAVALNPDEDLGVAPPKDAAASDEDATGKTAAASGEATDRPPEDGRPDELITFARVGEGFGTLPEEDLLYGGTDGDTLDAASDFEFTLDLDQVSGAGSHFKKTERDDDDLVTTTSDESYIYGTAAGETLTGTSAGDNIFGYAGDDVLIGGQGADSVTGGSGADQFVFEGGTGGSALAQATSLGTDTITDYSAADGDTFGLSDADFGLGAAGTLTGGTDYFESTTALTGTAQDISGGGGGPAIVVLGAGSGTDGVGIYYTDDASAMTTDNSYQIADVTGANTGDLNAGDFNLRA